MLLISVSVDNSRPRTESKTSCDCEAGTLTIESGSLVIYAVGVCYISYVL